MKHIIQELIDYKTTIFEQYKEKVTVDNLENLNSILFRIDLCIRELNKNYREIQAGIRHLDNSKKE